MSRRNTKITTQAEIADLVSALSEAAGSSSSSAPVHATRGASAALLAKGIIPNPQPVSTSSLGLGFRSFSPVASQSIPPASSCLFLSEDDLPPSNQLEVSQIVPEMMLPSRSGTMILPEITLPLNTLQVNTAYSLLRTLRNFCFENPGVLDTTSALVQLPSVGDVQSPYQVLPPAPAWPVPQLPLRGLSLDCNLRDEQEEYAENVYTYHFINAATALANALSKDVGEGYAAIQDISVGFGVDRQRIDVVCTEALGVVVYTDPAMDDEEGVAGWELRCTDVSPQRAHPLWRSQRSLPPAQRSYASTGSPAVRTEYSQKPELYRSPSSCKNVVQGRYPEV